MEEHESLAIVAFHIENDSRNEDILETPQNSRNQPHYKYNYNLKVGDNDRNGEKIEYIYECVPGKYFIYHTGYFDLQFVAEDETLISNNAEFNRIWFQIADYLANDYSLRQPFIAHLAYAIKNLHDGNSDTACNSLVSTYDSMTRRLRRRAVLPYLTGAFALVLASLISYFLVYLYGNLNDFGYMIFNAITFSAMGGFLSVAISLRNINVDVQDNFWTKAVYGFVRIIIAMISGVIIYFLIEGKVAFAFLKDIQNLNAYYIAFFVAGFSEKLISNLIFDFGNKGNSKATILDKDSN
jgi:hypothetical protein